MLRTVRSAFEKTLDNIYSGAQASSRAQVLRRCPPALPALEPPAPIPLAARRGREGGKAKNDSFLAPAAPPSWQPAPPPPRCAPQRTRGLSSTPARSEPSSPPAASSALHSNSSAAPACAATLPAPVSSSGGVSSRAGPRSPVTKAPRPGLRHDHAADSRIHTKQRTPVAPGTHSTAQCYALQWHCFALPATRDRAPPVGRACLRDRRACKVPDSSLPLACRWEGRVSPILLHPFYDFFLNTSEH